MNPLSKLRFQPSKPLHVLGNAAGTATVNDDSTFQIVNALPQKDADAVQQVLLFARDAAGLRKDFAVLAPHLANGAVLWIAYPKKTGAITSDLTRDKGWEVVDEWGYVGISQASLDADWSALWFKKPEQLRSFKRATPMHERVAEGVDYKARTVTLPADAAEAVAAVPGLREFFEAFSFSHKREWAEAIAKAKKPETRARRITKMVADLTGQKEMKAAASAAKQKA